MRGALVLLGAVALLPIHASAQSASEVERCFQNPGACSTAAPVQPPAGGNATTRPADYASVLQSPDAERRRIQESLRTLDKYNGPLDGNLQSDATVKGIGDWQRSRSMPVTGKLSPEEVATLHAEAARTPIKRIEPPTIATAPPTAATPSHAEQLKALQARLAERRKVAEPKAKAAADALIRDLKVYVETDGKTGTVGEQFAYFANWHRDARAAGRTVGEVTPVVEDYGDARNGSAVTIEVRFDVKQSGKNFSQCLMFAWTEQAAGSVRENAKAFSCDDIAAVEKWKSDLALRSAWR
jgi:hypothetical protein